MAASAQPPRCGELYQEPPGGIHQSNLGPAKPSPLTFAVAGVAGILLWG